MVVPIHRAAQHLAKAASEALIPFELQHSEFEVLQTLLLAADEPMTPSDLYRALLVSSGGLTKILDRLQRRELISIASDAKDRRRRQVSLTGSGRELAGRAERAVIAAEAKCLNAVLADPSYDALAQLLPRMITDIEGEGGAEAVR